MTVMALRKLFKNNTSTTGRGIVSFNKALSDENESGLFRRDARKSAKKDSWMMTDKGRKHFGAPQKFIKKSPAKSNKKTAGKTTK